MFISRPVGLFVAVAVVGIGVYMYASAQQESPSAKAAAVASKSADKPSEYTDEDYSAHFDSPDKKAPIHNVFMPVVRNDSGSGVSTADPSIALKDAMRIPATVAGGDPNWIFTGYAVINGVRSALLENRTTHKSDFVTEGASWKASRLLHIAGAAVVFDDLAGGQVSVTRFDPSIAGKSDVKAEPDAGLKPLDPSPALQGPIGPGPTRNPGQGRVRVMNGMPPGMMIVNGGAVTLSAGG